MPLQKDDFVQITLLCERLHAQAHAKAVVLIEKSGQLIAHYGSLEHIDLTSLCALAAGHMAATQAIAQLLGEREFPTAHHEGERLSIHFTQIPRKGVLMVIYDASSRLGLVRLRAESIAQQIAPIFDHVLNDARIGPSPFVDVTDADIDRLFN